MYTRIRRGNVRGIRLIGPIGTFGGRVVVVSQDGNDQGFACTDKRLAAVYMHHPGDMTAHECLAFVRSILRPGQWRMVEAQLHKARSASNG